MNLKEGTRRLALLLGVAGALGGSFVSYLEWQELHSKKTRRDRFEQFATLDAVKHLSKDHQQKKDDPLDANIRSVMPGCCGIKEIVWDRDHVWNDGGGIYSIETLGGETLQPWSAPSAWEYLFATVMPIIGFIIPWGLIRAIGWVMTGFVQPSQ